MHIAKVLVMILASSYMLEAGIKSNWGQYKFTASWNKTEETPASLEEEFGHLKVFVKVDDINK